MARSSNCLFWSITMRVLLTTTGLQGSLWTKKPGEIMVLEGTTARFTWAYSDIRNSVLSWYRNNCGESVSGEFLMSIFIIGANVTYQHMPRLTYMGDVSIELANVSSADNGAYSARVTKIYGNNSVDTSYGKLMTIPAIALRYNITITGQTFQLSVLRNGTSVTLPTVTSTVPHKIVVSVNVDRSAPGPSITFQYDGENTTCHECYILERQIPRNRMDTSCALQMLVTIKYNIQNVDLINIRLNVLIDTRENPWKVDPAQVYVLTGTDALFNWTHTLLGVRYITWEYTDHGRNQTAKQIMSYSAGGLHVNKDEEYSTRAFHTTGLLGSAGLILKYVTAHDDGLYEVEIRKHRSQTVARYRSKGTYLCVVSEADLGLQLSIDGASCGKLSTKRYATCDIQPSRVSRNTVAIKVSVELARKAPGPFYIEIEYTNDRKSFDRITCYSTYSCERSIDMHRERDNWPRMEIIIKIIHNIQNMRELILTRRLVMRIDAGDGVRVKRLTARKAYSEGIAYTLMFGYLIIILVLALIAHPDIPWRTFTEMFSITRGLRRRGRLEI